MIDFRCLSRWPLLLTLGVVAISMLTSETRSQGSRLGSVKFPTSAKSQEAQEHFLRGVAALHSFWYPVALEEFRTAARIEPSFAMAHWGEAMAHNHPVWGDPQDTDAARQVLSRLPATSDVTPRERGYIDAVKALYGEGDKAASAARAAYALAHLPPARDVAGGSCLQRGFLEGVDQREDARFPQPALATLRVFAAGSHE